MLPRARKNPLPEHIDIESDGVSMRVRLRNDPRARRYLLRLPADYSGPVLTVPKGGDLARAERFVRENIDWLLERVENRPGHIAFAFGNIIPVRGVDHAIAPTGKLRGLVNVTDADEALPRLNVPGSPDHAARKLTTWLKAEAKADLTVAAMRYAEQSGKNITGLSIRDTKSRWGSCASNGRLSFSWRLILAPTEILDYVAAHEVAHLTEMNHSARFWDLCRDLAPHTPHARKWLKENGIKLHGYG